MFSSILPVITTAEAEVESLTVKLTGTLALFKVISIRRTRQQSIRLAMMSASSKASDYNRRTFHAKPHDKRWNLDHVPVPARARKLVPLTRPWLRGWEYNE